MARLLKSIIEATRSPTRRRPQAVAEAIAPANYLNQRSRAGADSHRHLRDGLGNVVTQPNRVDFDVSVSPGSRLRSGS